MDFNVFVNYNIIESKESVNLVILINIMMESIVYVIMDSLKMLTNVKNVMKVVENVQAHKIRTVLHVQMLVTNLLMVTAKVDHLAQMVFIFMHNCVSLVLLIVLVVNLKEFVKLVSKALN